MFRLSHHRSKSCYRSRTRSYQSISTELTSDNTEFKSLRMRIREAAHERRGRELTEIRNSSLYQECYEWGRRQAQAASRNHPPANLVNARNAAAVHTICYALDAFIGFSRHYDSPSKHPAASAPNATDLKHEFLKQIRNQHRNHLLAQFRQSMRANSEERRAAVVSALDPQLIDHLTATGVISVDDIRQEVNFHRRQLPLARTLNEAELLAIVDYLNSGTGTFNVVNGTAMASAYYGEHALHSRTVVFGAALASAIDKLCDHPYFGRRDTVCYKGIRLNGLDTPFRLAMLNSAHANKGWVAFPNVLSASCDPEHSYAKKKFDEGYTLECMLTMRKGFYADPFHDVHTMGEQEILGPANQRFRVTGKSSFKIFDWRGETPQEVDVDRYEMKPEDL